MNKRPRLSHLRCLPHLGGRIQAGGKEGREHPVNRVIGQDLQLGDRGRRQWEHSREGHNREGLLQPRGAELDSQ